MFTDDLNILKIIISIEDCVHLKNDLNSFVSIDFGLGSNIGKGQSMIFNRCRIKVDFIYDIQGVSLSLVSPKNDLDIICTCTCSLQGIQNIRKC